MNKQKWLVAGLSLAMAASLSLGLTACSIGKKPDTPVEPEHTHTYDAWDHNETQHWKYCDEHGTDKSNIDESTKANHTFTNGTCVCGATQGSETPTAELDTREFYVVGGGMGDLATGTWTGPNASFKFTKATEPDENGYTVYTYQMKLYSADEFKFIEQNTISQGTDADGNATTVWDEATTFMLADLDVTTVPDAFTGEDNIVVNTGADGVYKFTLLTKKGGLAKENKMKVELVEPIEPLDITAQYEMYIVGTVKSKPGTAWPSSFTKLSDVQTKCYKLELQEDGRTFSIEVELATTDEFKIWNYKLGNKDAGYYPTGMGGNLSVKENGWYVVSWKVGDAKPSITAHEHRYTEWGHDDTQHWKQCPLDQAIDETTKASHTFDPETHTCECGALETESCAHDGEIKFEYTAETLPEQVAEGGTLKGRCEKCGKEIDVPYDKGATCAYPSPPIAPITLEDGKSCYAFTAYGGLAGSGEGVYMLYEIKNAGVVTIKFNIVYKPDTFNHFVLHDVRISDEALGNFDNTTFARTSSVYRNAAWNTNKTLTDSVAKWKEQITTDEPLNGYNATINSLTVTFKEEDVGKYFYLRISGNISGTNGTALLIKTSFAPAAATTVAPAEVALLPSKED